MLANITKMYACNIAIKNSMPIIIIKNNIEIIVPLIPTKPPKATRETQNPANILSNMCPAIMLAAKRIARLNGRIKNETTSNSATTAAIGAKHP